MHFYVRVYAQPLIAYETHKHAIANQRSGIYALCTFTVYFRDRVRDFACRKFFFFYYSERNIFPPGFRLLLRARESSSGKHELSAATMHREGLLC